MPFTFSHPAIVLPFCKSKWIKLSLTGLIMGSMVPDMEFLLQLRETDVFGHTWLGVIVLDIPVAIIMSFVFHILIRNTLILNLPQQFRQRFSAFLSFHWKDYCYNNKLVFLISIIIGMASHFFLDAFTHRYGFIVNHLPSLLTKVNLFNKEVAIYYLLQIITSLVGALFILWFVLKMKKGKDVTSSNNMINYWASLSVITIGIIAVRFVVYTKQQTAADIMITVTGAFVYALFIVSIYYRRKTATINNE